MTPICAHTTVVALQSKWHQMLAVQDILVSWAVEVEAIVCSGKMLNQKYKMMITFLNSEALAGILLYPIVYPLGLHNDCFYFILFNFRFSHLLSWFHFSFVNVFCQEFTFAFNCLFFHISHPKLIKLILRYSFTTFTFHCSHQGHDTDSVSRVSRQACLWNRTSERFICDPTQPQWSEHQIPPWTPQIFQHS